MIKNALTPHNWKHIKSVISLAQKSSMYCSIATVDSNGMPTITPIGTLFLREEIGQAFFFNTYSSTIEHNISQNPHICIQDVNNSRTFWIKSMLQGLFNNMPGVRLYGEIKARRPATSEELALVEKRIKALKWTKGGQLIWSSFSHVHDVDIQNFKWIEYLYMMPKLD